MDNNYTITIGKDIIESLTTGMYEDSKFIFREYIQNSADQIDKAVKEGLLAKGQGEIHININPSKREITIHDNATGIPQNQVASVLLDIAKSTKTRGVDKGFRGIGRLGGLAYCECLVFETSFKGESTKTILSWNAAQLKDIINNRGEKEEAAKVIGEVTTLGTAPEQPSEHYFKVTLKGVTNDSILDAEEVNRYLSMVAPLPFPGKFIFKTKIYDELRKEGIILDEYKIYLNTEQLFKAYSTYIYNEEGKGKVDEVVDVVFFKEQNNVGELLYWGWYSISGLNYQLRVVNKARGLRLRKANIQIGNEATLSKLYRDPRFHYYFFGEIHGVHSDFIPNSRRDYFVENAKCLEFERKLKPFFEYELSKLCKTASELNSSVRKIEELYKFEEQFKLKQEQGFTGDKEKTEFVEKYETKKREAENAKKTLDKIEQVAREKASPVQTILKRVSTSEIKGKIEPIDLLVENKKAKFRTDKLSRLTKDQRKFLGRIYTIIQDVLDPNTAESLIRKIEDELK